MRFLGFAGPGDLSAAAFGEGRKSRPLVLAGALKATLAMAAPADEATIPLPFRALLPAPLWSLLNEALTGLKRRAQQPTVPPMSEQWLRDHAAQERPGDE